MSPILVRPVREQFEHDKVIRLLQARWRRRYQVGVNLGTEQSAPAGTGARTVYPDLVLSTGTRGHRVQGVVEVETGESVNSLEAMAQWARFAALGVPLYLYVPSGSVDAARRLCAEHGIPVAEIWSYYSFGDQIRFTMIHRSAARPAGSSARKRPAGAAGKRAPARKAAKGASSGRAPKKRAASGAGKTSKAASGAKGKKSAKAGKGNKNASRRNTSANTTASGRRPRRAAAAAKRQPAAAAASKRRPSRLVERQRSRGGKRQPSRASAKRQQPPRSVKRPARAARQARRVSVSGRAQRRK